MANAEQGAHAVVRARLHTSTTVFLVGNIEPTMEWYKRLGFKSDYYPYIITDDVKGLQDEYSALPGIRISRHLTRQDYGMIEFDVIDLNGHRLVFAQPTPPE